VPVNRPRAFAVAGLVACAVAAWGGVDPDSVVVRVIPKPQGAARHLRESEKSLQLPPPSSSPSATPAPGPPRVRPTPDPRPRTVTPITDRQLVIKKSAVAARALPLATKLTQLDRFSFGVPPAVKDKQGKGPGPTMFDLLEGLRADVPLERDAILRVGAGVFQDQNPVSGLFYFVPQSYGLDWTPGEGYGLRMLYSAVEGGEPGEVVTAARLDAGVDTREVELATALLRAYQARHPGVAFTELRPLPIDRPPDVSFGGDLQHQYDIPPEKIAITAISDALGEIEVSWVSDTITKENIQLALVEEVGLNGSLALTAAGGGVPAQSVPVRVRLADAATFGRIAWSRGQAWRNETAYPLRLAYLHALLIEKNAPVVYSWSLGDTLVPPRARLELQPITIPSWLDARAARMWIEYTPVQSCETCDQAVIASITGGVTSLGSSQITFRTITPLADLGAYEITARVRSRYFDPGSRETQTKPALPLNADNQDFTLGPVFLVNRQPGQSVPGDPLFEYTLDVAMPDGSLRRGTRWLAVNDLRVLVGRVQVEQAVGKLPGAPKP
jgi:hypothetical protein